jgi:membrane protein YdbS with pleckstrin-like domain
VNNSPEGWGRRVLSALALVLAISIAARWVFELLRPIVPFAVSGAVVLLVVLAVLRRRRW